MNYYLLQQDMYIKGTLALGDVPFDVEPSDWLQGKKMPQVPTPITLELSPTSGTTVTDIILSFLPVFSDRLKQALAALGISNIDYYECCLHHPEHGVLNNTYWLANIIGRIKCIDLEKSVYLPRPSGRGGTLKQFVVDERLTQGYQLFRLYEEPVLIVISESVKQHLEKAKLKGIYLPSTQKYNGTVSGSLFDRT